MAQRRLFASFAGVMLADILANSVALLIVLIIVTVAIKHEAEQERLEQVEDVGVLLSREISRSVVVNALPTSAPAVLHDYETSPIDRVKLHAVMPIIELHRGYLRDYYTGDIFTRNELLLQDSRFDRYLRAMKRPQLQRIRVDIYEIDLFYIVMSILKSYNHSPAHWHFLAYQPGDKRATGKPSSQRKKDADKEGENGELGEGEGEQSGEEPGAGQEMRHGLPSDSEPGEGDGSGGESAELGLPAQISYDQPPSESAAYPNDEISFDRTRRGGQAQGQQSQEINLPGQVNPQQSNEVRQSDEMFDALARMMDESMERQQGQASAQPQTARFRTATNQQQSQQEQEQQQQMMVEMPSFRILLPALFEFMRNAQRTADEYGRSLLANFDMLKQVFPLVGQVTESPQEKALYDAIHEALQASSEEKETLPLVAETDEARRRSVLAVPVNQRIDRAFLAGNAAQPPIDGVPGELPVSSRLSLYPLIYKGIRSPLRGNMMVLMPEAEQRPQGFRWRVITTVSPQTDDFVVAFVYAAIDAAGRLLIATDENVLELDGVAVTTNYPVVPLRSELWVTALYGIAALLVAFGVLRTFRRRV